MIIMAISISKPSITLLHQNRST